MADSPSGYEIEDRIEADLEFHRTLCWLSENDTLLHAWEQLEGSIRMSIMFGGYERGCAIWMSHAISSWWTPSRLATAPR